MTFWLHLNSKSRNLRNRDITWYFSQTLKLTRKVGLHLQLIWHDWALSANQLVARYAGLLGVKKYYDYLYITSRLTGSFSVRVQKRAYTCILSIWPSGVDRVREGRVHPCAQRWDRQNEDIDKTPKYRPTCKPGSVASLIVRRGKKNCL